MDVLTIDLSSNKNYFYYKSKRFAYISMKNDFYVIEDKCKHRGGPLSLGTVNEDKMTVTCPWHKIENCSIHLKKMSMPSVISDNKLSVIMTGQ